MQRSTGYLEEKFHTGHGSCISLAQLFCSHIFLRNIALRLSAPYILHQASYQMHHQAPYQTAAFVWVVSITNCHGQSIKSQIAAKRLMLISSKWLKSLLSFLADAKYAYRGGLLVCGSTLYLSPDELHKMTRANRRSPTFSQPPCIQMI